MASYSKIERLSRHIPIKLREDLSFGGKAEGELTAVEKYRLLREARRILRRERIAEGRKAAER